MKYVGSKARISRHILPIIQGAIDRNGIETYVEPFVGGGNLIDKKFRKYMDDGKTKADIDKTTAKEFLRVDWKMHGRITWFHVSEELEYY